jgi:hypothetical protein
MVYTLLLIFFLFSLVAFFPPQAKLLGNLYFVTMGIVLVLIAGFRGDVDRDYSGYVDMFNRQDFFVIEPTFSLISYFVHALVGSKPILLFLIYAVLGVAIKFLAIRQLTNLWFLSVVIYLGNFYILHEMTQIRAGVASGLLLLCVKPIYERDWKIFLFITTLACTFHFSALVILPLWFLGHNPRKIWLLISIPSSYVFYFSGINLIRVIPILGVQEKIEIYQNITELELYDFAKTNAFSLVFLAKISIFYFLLFKYDLIYTQNKYFSILMKIYSISLMSYLIFTTVPAISTRINELYGIVDIILVPMIFYVFKPIHFSRGIVVFIGLSLMLIMLYYSKLII